MTAILLGRTLIGERCFDIRCAIDQLSHFPECDTEKIAITGNSGGSTISYYAAAYDSRIGLSMPSCAVCPCRESIAKMNHCSCNYIPGALRYFDMQDIAARCSLITVKRGHFWNVDVVWPEMRRQMQSLGWLAD